MACGCVAICEMETPNCLPRFIKELRQKTKMSGRGKPCNRMSRGSRVEGRFFSLMATYYKRTERTGRPADAYRHVAHMPIFFWPDWRLQGCRGVRTEQLPLSAKAVTVSGTSALARELAMQRAD